MHRNTRIDEKLLHYREPNYEINLAYKGMAKEEKLMAVIAKQPICTRTIPCAETPAYTQHKTQINLHHRLHEHTVSKRDHRAAKR